MLRSAGPLVFLLFPAGAFAQAGDVAALFQRDPVEEHGARLLTGILALGIGLILYSLVRYRGRVQGSTTWAVFTFALIVLPFAVIAFGSILVFQRAEKVSFCGSCHLAMDAYVKDLLDPGSSSLAAVHYKNRYIAANQCYACHTSYGLFGTIEAKIAGIWEVQKYYTRSFGPQLRMRKPYRNDDCLKCHAGAIRWGKAHEEFRDVVFHGEISCLKCHGQEHPAHMVGGKERAK